MRPAVRRRSRITVTGTDPAHRPSATFRIRANRIIAALVVVALVASCGGKTEEELATDELNAGLAASAAGNGDEAVAHYEACLQHNARNQFCIYNLGVHAFRAGRVEEAESDYRLALLIDPDFAFALFNLAHLQSQKGTPVAIEEAIQLYRRYVQLSPDDASGHLNLGTLLLQTGDIAGGNAEIAAARRLDPTIVVPTVQPLPTPSPVPTSTGSPSPPPSGSPSA